MNSHIRLTHWLLIGGWLLLTPPTPLGTALPPLSEWSKVSTHTSPDECERNRERMREAARRTVTSDPNAPALKVAAALGQLQSRCVEGKDKRPPAANEQAATPPADPPIANPPVEAAPEP
jgi:hypothetical protein